MRLVKKIIIAALIMSVIDLHFPGSNIAANKSMFAGTEAGITEHAPEMLAPPEIDIPVEAVSRATKSDKTVASEKKGNTWVWYLGGALLVGGIAAAAGGGGGGGGDSSSTGDITVSW